MNVTEFEVMHEGGNIEFEYVWKYLLCFKSSHLL